MSKYINADALKAKVKEMNIFIDLNDSESDIDCYMLTYLLERIEKSLIDIIDNMEAADVAPVVHAEWVHRYNDFGEQIDDRWYCSQCAGCNEYRRTWHCPECGTKMDGKEVE